MSDDDTTRAIVDYADKSKTYKDAVEAEVKARHRLHEAGAELGKVMREHALGQIGEVTKHFNGTEMQIADVVSHHSDKSVACPSVVQRNQNGHWGKRRQTLHSWGWHRDLEIWDRIALNGQTGRQIFASTGEPQK